MFIVAEAGLGKTTLLDLGRRVAPASASVVRARGSPMDVDVPFGLAAQMLEPLGGDRLVDPGVDPGEALASLLDRTRRWVEAAAAVAPLLLVLDDVHWADPDSLTALSVVIPLVARLPVGLIAGLRPWPATALQMAGDLAAARRAELVRLAPLSRDASDELLAAGLGGPPSAAVAAGAWAFASGNPYLIEEVAGLVRAHGRLPQSGAEPSTLQHVLLLAKLASLPEPAIRCAQAAAVLGDEFRAAFVAPVAGLDPDAAAEALDLLFAARVVREAKPGWGAFVHSLVRQAVYDDLLPGRRTALHRRAFELLADLGDVGAAARHAIAADLVGEERAVSAIEAAARASFAAGAVLAAVELFGAAIALAAAGAAGSLHAAHGHALLATGRPLEAAESFRAALGDDSLEGPARVAAYRSMALALAYGGDLAASAELSGRALELARRVAPEAVSGVLVDRVHAVWQAEGPHGARRELGEMAATGALPTDATFEAARLFITYCGTGDPAVLPQLAAIADHPAEGPVSPFEPRLVHGCVARWEEQFDEDDRVLDRADAAARDQGVLRARFAIALARVDNRLLRGRPEEALAVLEALEQDVPIEPLIAPAVAVAAAATFCWLGRLDEASARLAEAGEGGLMWQVELVRRSVVARLHLERGHRVDACDAYREVETLVEQLGVNAPLVVPWAAGAIAAYGAAHRLGDLARVCAWLEQRASSAEGWAAMVAGVGRARLAAAAGDAERAGQLYLEAASMGSHMPLERAGVLVAYGEWLRASGRPVQARPQFAEALAIADGAGARLLAAHAAAGLRSAGGRRSKARSRPGQLSEQERRVAALAGDGLTTLEIAARLYLSPKTVESHLGNVYTKLGITSRRQLRGRTFEDAADGAPGV